MYRRNNEFNCAVDIMLLRSVLTNFNNEFALLTVTVVAGMTRSICMIRIMFGYICIVTSVSVACKVLGTISPPNHCH